MPITAISGLPGNGKTALMLEMLRDQGAATKDQRHIVACGIEGLKPGLAQVLDDPKQWNDIDSSGEPVCTCAKLPHPHAHVVPNGSIVFVDEAWKWFGHLHDAGRQATPSHVLALAEHRHRGIDFVWTFQTPAQIYPFARGLIASHFHVVRRFGSQLIDVFQWAELNDDVKSPAKREAALRKTRTLPKDVFDLYKSAEVHTIKAKIPYRVLALPLLVVAAGFLTWFAYKAIQPDAITGSGSKEPSAALAAPALSPDAAARPGRVAYATAADYAVAHTPRIESIPGSAPIFDGRSAKSDPQLFCMSSGHNGSESCSCLTEQGTSYTIDPKMCRLTARNGAPYNPYKQAPKEQRAGGVGGQPPTAMASADAAPVAGMIEAPQISAYGDVGITNNPGSAP